MCVIHTSHLIQSNASGHRPPEGFSYRPGLMYRCQQCFTLVSANQPSFLLTVQSRSKEYPKRQKVQSYQKDGRACLADDSGGRGYEIVKEIRVCQSCYLASCRE